MSTYGGKLRQLRERQRLSQQEVAEFLNVAQSTYSLWESDKSTPQIGHLSQLSEILQVDIQELLPQSASVKIVNSNSSIDNSVIGFEIRMEARELFKDLLDTKDG